jgi:antitoxin HigA-1
MRDYTNFVSPLPHPGGLLREDYLPQYELTPGALAKAMGVERTRVENLVREKTSISSDTALRLGKVFNTSADYWLNMQVQHDLSKAALEHRDEIAALKPLPVPDAA